MSLLLINTTPSLYPHADSQDIPDTGTKPWVVSALLVLGLPFCITACTPSHSYCHFSHHSQKTAAGSSVNAGALYGCRAETFSGDRDICRASAGRIQALPTASCIVRQGCSQAEPQEAQRVPALPTRKGPFPKAAELT